MSTAGSHLERLTAVDASFLTNESGTSHMHIGGILIFEGPPPVYDDFLDQFETSGGESIKPGTEPKAEPVTDEELEQEQIVKQKRS